MPTVSINMAKPTSAKNDTVALSEWMRSRPLRPRMTPATSSPTMTGTNARRLAAHSGPARPAATISASWPRLTRRAYAHHDSPTDPEIEPGSEYQYVVGWSLPRDIEILLATLPAVLSRRGAH